MNQEDRNQIMELISKNAYYYDYNQPEKRVKIFTPDLQAETWLAGEPRIKTDTAEDFIEVQHKRRDWLTEQGIQPRHYNTDVLIEEVSDGVVMGTVMQLTTWQKRDEKRPEVVHTGIYNFEFRKQGGVWMISKRISRIDHP